MPRAASVTAVAAKMRTATETSAITGTMETAKAMGMMAVRAVGIATTEAVTATPDDRAPGLGR